MSEAQFGDRLKRLRSILGATQEEMARHLGVDVQTIKAWEGGKERAVPKAGPEDRSRLRDDRGRALLGDGTSSGVTPSERALAALAEGLRAKYPGATVELIAPGASTRATSAVGIPADVRPPAVT